MLVMKKYIILFLIVLLSFLLVISGCSRDSVETKEKTPAEQPKETSSVVKKPIPGVTKFEAPKDTSLGVPENKNLILILGNDGTTSSTVFKVDIFEETETGKIDAYLPGGEFYTIQEGDEKKIGIGIRTLEGTEKGSDVKIVIHVSNDDGEYASGSFKVSI